MYLSLPVIRILTGAQPLAGAAADSFLAAFAPYFVLSLATVASVGGGNYTFAAYSLATSTFWIHVHATIARAPAARRRLRRDPEAGRRRAPAAPGGADAGGHRRARGVALYGLARSRDAATLNNVAFAGAARRRC